MDPNLIDPTTSTAALPLWQDATMLYYLFSTVAQTVAVGFGVLGAVACFRLQTLSDRIKTACEASREKQIARHNGTGGLGDFDAIVAAGKEKQLPRLIDDWKAPATFQPFSDTIRKARKARMWLGWAISAALLCTLVTAVASVTGIACASILSTDNPFVHPQFAALQTCLIIALAGGVLSLVSYTLIISNLFD